VVSEGGGRGGRVRKQWGGGEGRRMGKRVGRSGRRGRKRRRDNTDVQVGGG